MQAARSASYRAACARRAANGPEWAARAEGWDAVTVTPPSVDAAEAPAGRYNIQAVARRTGVPAPTIRAWERRYGLPRPSRSEGRQRLYSEDDVRVIEGLGGRRGGGPG